MTETKSSILDDMASDFGTEDAIRVESFVKINHILSKIHDDLKLPRHDELNARLFPWVTSAYPDSALYATRLWESGLVPAGKLNITWSDRRLGHYYKRGYAADVFGMILRKDAGTVDARYEDHLNYSSNKIDRTKIPTLRREPPKGPLPISLLNRLHLTRKLVFGSYYQMITEISNADIERPL